MNIYKWMEIEGDCIQQFVSTTEIEPWSFLTVLIIRYGVFRRSALDPIFNPYFVDYGYDKIEFYKRIDLYRSDVCYQASDT